MSLFALTYTASDLKKIQIENKRAIIRSKLSNNDTLTSTSVLRPSSLTSAKGHIMLQAEIV